MFSYVSTRVRGVTHVWEFDVSLLIDAKQDPIKNLTIGSEIIRFHNKVGTTIAHGVLDSSEECTCCSLWELANERTKALVFLGAMIDCHLLAFDSEPARALGFSEYKSRSNEPTPPTSSWKCVAACPFAQKVGQLTRSRPS